MEPSQSKKQSPPDSTLDDLKSPSPLGNPKKSSAPIPWKDLAELLAPYTQRYTASGAARLLGDAQLAGIGEGTHRAAEMFQAQCDIAIERIRTCNCRAVFIEADATDVAIVFRAFTEDPAKGREILAKSQFLTIGNRGISNLLSFIADWNSEKPMDRVSVVGIDYQSKNAGTVLKNFELGLKQGEPLKPELQDFIKTYEKTSNDHVNKKATTQSYLAVSVKAGALLPRLTDEFVRKACEDIKELYAAYALVGINGPEHREQFMAKSVAAGVNEASKNGKTSVVLAHNGHITHAPRAEYFFYSCGMGEQLKGKDYRVLIQLAGGGRLGALKGDPQKGVTDHTHPSPQEGDIEKVLSHLSKTYHSGQAILVDIDSAMKDEKLKKLLSEIVFNVNSIGIQKPPSTHFTVHVPALAHGIAFFPLVSAEEFSP